MRFEVLGSLRAVARVGPVDTAAAAVSLGGPKQRLVLALLLAQPNAVVSVERLVEGVWGDDAPDSARHTVQAYISELRKEVGPVIHRHGPGYQIDADAESLDSLDFEDRISVVPAVDPANPVATIEGIERALSLWRGEAFQDFAGHESLHLEAVRLEELRLGAIEALMAARLSVGRHVEVAADLDRLTREHPYREELRAAHMLALYRSGRQADALRAYRDTRRVLGEGLGIDPSPRLRRLEEQILFQDPDLELPMVSGRGPRAGGHVENPYLGLRAFHEEDHARFFGREDLVARLVSRVHGDRTLTAVVGPSGSGKSSAVSAGLVPRLREEIDDVLITRLQPGVQPIAELEAALDRVFGSWERDRGGETVPPVCERISQSLPDGSTLVLVIDQLEELYTMVEPDERARFLRAVVAMVERAESDVHVVMTLRADFYDRPLAEPDFGPVFADNVVNVVPLDTDQLEAAAIRPARQVDVTLEPRLIGRLIHDVAGQPNGLPLFQYALTEMFEERDGAVLDLATYERIGGVRKAIARRAEDLYARFDPREQTAARQFLLRISTVSGSLVGRRRVPASELVSLDVDIVALNGVIDAFSRHRLLVLDRDPVTSAPTVEVAHEALLEEWDRLREWIEQDRDDLATHSSYVIAVAEWERSGRDPGYLLAGTRLEDYERWAGETRLSLTASERELMDASVTARDLAVADSVERDVTHARLRRRSNRQLVLLAAIAALLVGIVAYPVLTRTDRDTVVLALDSPRSVGGFAALLARGLDAAVDAHGVSGIVLEPPYSDPEAALREAAADRPDLMLAGSNLSPMLVGISADFPDTTFVTVDHAEQAPPPNVVSVGFAVEQGSFLVGVAAALESTTGNVGYIGANGLPFIEAFRAGFEQGAGTADQDVQVVSRLISHDVGVLPGYLSPDLAREIATEMYLEQDVDIIFSAAGPSGAGVVEAATTLSTPDRHLWVIGVDSDTYLDVEGDAREHVLTSMLKRVDAGVRVVTGRHVDGEQLPSHVTLTLEDGAVGYATSGNHLAAATIDTLDSFERAIATGRLHVDNSPGAPLDTSA